MKYIMFKRGNWCVPVLFPNALVHADMAAALTAPGAPMEGWKVDSAGERSCLGGEAHSKSSTLKVKSRKRDTRIIEMNDYGAGWV